MTFRVSHTWLTTSSDSDIDTTVRAIITALSGNPIFPAPSPDLEAITTLFDNFIAGLDAAKDGGKAETAAKNAARVALQDGMRLLGQYLEKTAGNLEQILTSKYPLQKERAPLGIQPAPANLRLKHGKVSGSIAAVCDVGEHRVMYEWQTATGENPTEWKSEAPTTSSRTNFEGVAPGTWLNARVRARVPAGAGDWSGVSRIMVV
jgi:hypothetical protein